MQVWLKLNHCLEDSVWIWLIYTVLDDDLDKLCQVHQNLINS